MGLKGAENENERMSFEFQINLPTFIETRVYFVAVILCIWSQITNQPIYGTCALQAQKRFRQKLLRIHTGSRAACTQRSSNCRNHYLFLPKSIQKTCSSHVQAITLKILRVFSLILVRTPNQAPIHTRVVILCSQFRVLYDHR